MAVKQLNKRLVIGLGLFGFACMILLSVLMLRQLQRRDPKYFIQLAENAASQQQWQQAAVFYNELWLRTGEPQYYVRLGDMLLEDGEIPKALFYWRQALVHQPDLLAAHERQLDLLLETARLYGTPQRWEQVNEAAEAMLAATSAELPVEQAVAHHAKGLALINLESRDQENARRGLASLAEAAKAAPDHVEYPIDLARELIRQERIEEGERLYRELIDRHATAGSDASRVRLAFAEYLAEKQRTDEAEKLFQQSLEFAGGDAAALRDAEMGYARFLTQRWARAMRDPAARESAAALFEKAEQTLKASIAAEPDQFEPYLHTALLYKAAQRFADVVDVCEQRIRRGLSRKGVQATKNRISMFTLMISASEACVALGLKTTDTAEREKWLAKAEQYVTDAKGESASHPRVLSQAGRVKLARGQDREALKELRAADEAYGSYDAVNWENKIILAQVHLKLNEAGAAKEVLESVLEQAGRYRARDPLFWNLYAQVLFQNNELDRSLAVSDRVLILDPTNADARHLKAAIYERQGKHEAAGQIHAELTGSTTVQAMLKARAAAMGGDAETAVGILREAMEKDPSDARLVAAAVQELLGLGRHDEAHAVAEKALKGKPDDIRLQQLSLITRRDLTPEQRDEATLKLIESEEDAFQRDLDLVMFHSRRDDVPAALRAIDAAEQRLLAKDTPLARSATSTQHAALLKAKIRAAAQLNDEAAMTAARDAAIRHNVDGAGGKSLLGWYHLQRKEFDLALNAFREAVAAQPTDSTSLAQLGQCLQLLGRLDEAQAAYAESVKLNPNEGIAHQGLALVAQTRGDMETFQRELAECRRLLPNDPWVQEQTTIRAEEADPAAAIRSREARQGAAPDDVGNLQRLAILYAKVGDHEKAERTYARLMELRPDDEKVVLAAAAFYRKTGRPERALSTVTAFADARTDARQKRFAPLLVADEHVQQGKPAEAERVLLAAFEASPSMEVAQAVAELYVRALRRPADAAPWFQRAIDIARRDNSAVVARLFDSKIACLLDRSVNDLEQGRRDVAALRGEHPEFVRGLLWESEIFARTGDIDRAVGKLSEYLDKRPNDAYALYQRARHLVSRGRTVAAVADLETVKRTAPLSLELQPRLLLARLQQRAGRRDLWIAELESLAQDAPQSPTAIEALVEAYLAEKRFADAERVVTAQINRDAQSAASARWYFLRGRISQAVGDADRAVDDLHRGAQAAGFAPERVEGVLAAHLQVGRFAAGIEYFERHAPQEPTAGVLSRYAQLLARADQKAKAVEQFRRAMAVAMSQPGSMPQRVGNDVLAVWPAADAATAFLETPSDAATARANDRLLARALGAAGRTDEAAARLDALLAAATDDASRANLLHERGDLYQTGGQTDRAIESYQEALNYDPTNWVTLNNIAYLLSDIRGANDAALSYAQKAVALEDNAFTLDTLGWIYVGLGRYPLAIAELSRAVRVNPDYALSYYHLGEAYRRNGQFTEAADILKDGQDLARAIKDEALVALTETSLAKTSRRDAAP